jgi:uncharacterized protein YodC (DUF2158 family)
LAGIFKKGDVVQLKSGGPKMTVDDVVKDGDVWAVWFAGAKRERAHFSKESIKPVEETETPTKKP